MLLHSSRTKQLGCGLHLPDDRAAAQVLITVLFNGGASTYLLSYWELFDSRECMSPAPGGHSLAVLVPQTSNDLDGDGGAGGQHHQPSNTGSYVS